METNTQCPIEKESFLRKYNITNEIYVDSGCSWKELEAIYTDFVNSRNEFLPTANLVADTLKQLPAIHSY